MKGLMSSIFLFSMLNYCTSQVLFLETFDEAAGATSGTDNINGVSWSTTAPFSISSTDYFKIVSGVLEGRDVNGPAEFVTGDIDISSCPNGVDISMDLSHTGTMENSGGCNSIDIIKLEYSNDGGASWSVIGNPSEGTTIVDTAIYASSTCGIGNVIGPFIALGNFTSFTFNDCVTASSTLKLRITVMEWADSERHRIDNIQVSCTNCGAPLPIELVDFIAYNNNGVNKLEWVTTSEINNDYYNLENSVDGYMWNTIGTIEGAGNSSNTLEYSYDHESYLDSINYYRLSQVDFDGISETFKIISIDNRIDDNILIKTINLLGQEVDVNEKGLVVEFYSNGTTRKVFRE